MNIKIYGIQCHESHLYMLKISKQSAFYLWSMGTLINVDKCIYHDKIPWREPHVETQKATSSATTPWL